MEDTIKEQLTAVNITLRSAYEPIVQLPATMALLREEGRPEDIPKVSALCKTIASDIDTFTAERDKVTQDLEQVIAQRPTSNSEMAGYNAKLTGVGLDYIQLNSRMVSTVMQSKQDYEDILGGKVPNAQEESVSQPAQPA
jgi:hypothetical protein